MIDKSMIEDMIKYPLSLLAIKDQQVIQQLNELIPYSSAFEIECDMVGLDRNNRYDDIYKTIIKKHNETFMSIPDIMDVSNDTYEQRYRIPNGIRGIICLYNISQQLKLNSLLNPKSSIHYHVDCTDCYEQIQSLLRRDEKRILKELDTWLGNDTAIQRGIGSWFRYNSLKTVEFRLGEMTFDYNIMLKRIMHCNQMIKRFKDELNIEPTPFEKPDKNKIIVYLKASNSTKIFQGKINQLNEQLKELTKYAEIEIEPIDEIKEIVRNRVHRIIKPSK